MVAEYTRLVLTADGHLKVSIRPGLVLKADIQISKIRLKLGAAFGQEQPFNDSYRSNLGHHIDGIVFPGVLDHHKSDLVARLSDFHRLIIDLHRFDFLLEV